MGGAPPPKEPKERNGNNMETKALIVVYSYHHNNTEKVANAMAAVLNAEVKRLRDVDAAEIQKYDLVGFGAGIDSGKHYAPLLEFAGALPDVEDKHAFIFSTSGIAGEKKMAKDHAALREILISKGYEIAGEFNCAGFDTNSVLKLIGGIAKERPNAEDLKAAEAFVRKLGDT